MAPVPAINNALSKVKIQLKEIEILEINEAFATKSRGVMAKLSK
ncbi:hypothetical protein [Ilyobacter polytropus]|nr:hypothetical protein [Ilyobacter polytropus]